MPAYQVNFVYVTTSHGLLKLKNVEFLAYADIFLNHILINNRPGFQVQHELAKFHPDFGEVTAEAANEQPARFRCDGISLCFQLFIDPGRDLVLI